MNCTKYFYEDIRSFLKTASDFKINRNCKSDVVNHVTFAFIVLVTVGGVSAWLLENINVFAVFIILSVLHAIFWYLRYEPFTEKTDTSKESFVDAFPDSCKEELIGEEITYPTANNPFMNVLVDELKYNVTRGPAASFKCPFINIELNDFFKTDFVSDPTDVFNKTQSQRQFYSMPSTTVPNDQDSYQNWLYKIPGKTCKEGGREACAAQAGSAGGAIPWLNSDN